MSESLSTILCDNCPNRCAIASGEQEITDFAENAFDVNASIQSMEPPEFILEQLSSRSGLTTEEVKTKLLSEIKTATEHMGPQAAEILNEMEAGLKNTSNTLRSNCASGKPLRMRARTGDIMVTTTVCSSYNPDSAPGELPDHTHTERVRVIE